MNIIDTIKSWFEFLKFEPEMTMQQHMEYYQDNVVPRLSFPYQNNYGMISGSAACYIDRPDLMDYSSQVIWRQYDPEPEEEPEVTLLRKEWKCEFCGAVHPYEEMDENGIPHHVGKCEFCGHPKTVVQMAGVQ